GGAGHAAGRLFSWGVFHCGAFFVAERLTDRSPVIHHGVWQRAARVHDDQFRLSQRNRST
ncbi:MAG: hypothetical protein ACKO38_04530, partial [Planctomycetota bacterium]